MAKSLSARQVLSISRKSIAPGGIWADCVGEMDRHGVVFVWGNSGNGKTSAVVSLCKELTAFGTVLYVSLEEGFSISMQNTLRRFGMQECGARFQVVDSCSLDELTERLHRQRSAEFVVIDSVQYMQMTYALYKKFKEANRNKMIILVSHAEGRQPAGRSARSIKYDAGLKIWVEGYIAHSQGRFIGSTGKAVIWEKGAAEYWGDKGNNDNNNDNQNEYDNETDNYEEEDLL